jgi:hypothetical protein
LLSQRRPLLRRPVLGLPGQEGVTAPRPGSTTYIYVIVILRALTHTLRHLLRTACLSVCRAAQSLTPASPLLCCIKGLTLTTVACSGAPAGAAGFLSTCCREGLAESVHSAARKSLHLPGRVDLRLRDEKHARALHLRSCRPDQPVVRFVGPDPPLRGSAGAHATHLRRITRV